LIANADGRYERNLFLFGIDNVGRNKIDIKIGSNGIFLRIISNITVVKVVGFKGKSRIGKNNVIAKKMGGEGVIAARLSEWKIKGWIGPGAIANGIG
jgi:hypothetical protein